MATVISTLSGLVVHFYRQQIADYKAAQMDLKHICEELTHRADTCEADREELRVKCAVMEARIERLEVKTRRDDKN